MFEVVLILEAVNLIVLLILIIEFHYMSRVTVIQDDYINRLIEKLNEYQKFTSNLESKLKREDNETRV